MTENAAGPVIFDGHNDVLLRLYEGKGTFLTPSDQGQLDLPRARQGGLCGGFCAVFVEPEQAHRTEPAESDDVADAIEQLAGVTPDQPYAHRTAQEMVALLFRLEEESQGQLKVVRSAGEIETCLREGTFAAVLHFEGAEAIDPGLDALEVFYQAGLRSLGPVWSRPNAFASGVPFTFPHSPDTGPGLTDAGRELVRACNRLGIMLDLSHLNEQGFWDVATLSDAPLVATHSNAHALAPSPRNLTDKQLDAIKESDGMVGVNFHVGFLREDGGRDPDMPLDTLVRHVDHLVERLGIDRVGFGSDFDGATMPREISDAAGLPNLIAALRRGGYDDAALRKLAHANWLRVLRGTWGAWSPPRGADRMEPRIVLDGAPLPVDAVVAVARRGAEVALGEQARRRMEGARAVVDAVVAEHRVVYGVNTGFGELSRVRISDDDLLTLQRNLMVSHAAGIGEPLPAEVVRAMLLLLAASLARGYSGVRPLVAEQVIALINRQVTPLVPAKGSVGASGDLAPLAHIGLVLIGEGEAMAPTPDAAPVRLPGRVALERAGLAPIELAAKEGLAIINGTHLMAAVGALAVHDAGVLVQSAEVAAALSLEALRGTDVPFDARIQAVRGQRGQDETAAHVRALLAGSGIIPSHREDDPRVQDPYSLRCIPQVLGAVRDTVAHCARIVEAELGAVTDNPLCFPDDGVILSGGNFHGQPVALALDILAVALAELAAFSERRTYLLLDDREPQKDRLPAFLAREPGLNSGYMIAQYAAASLVAENAVLATPAGLHSVPTSAGMEDFVSMGATAATKLRTVLRNAEHVVAIELLCAAEGVEYRHPLRAGAGVEEAVARVRALVPPLQRDRSLHPDIAALAEAVHDGRFAV